jgi:hypothetical protein
VFGSIIAAGKPLSQKPLSTAVKLKGKPMLVAGMATAVIGWYDELCDEPIFVSDGRMRPGTELDRT